tara:strand:- start:258 stop:461 length:204 start_codon:yes stop_codon:yes gene_type:complete
MNDNDNVVKLFESIEDKVLDLVEGEKAVVVLSLDEDGLSIGSNSEFDTIIMMLEAAKYRLLEGMSYH